VRFDLHVDGELRHALAPSDRRARIGVFLGDDVARALQEVKASEFHAYAAPPQFSRISAKGISFFLNGRYIRDRVLLRAVHEAYHEMIPHGRHPVVLVFLTLAPDEVDVNVHPTKIEVRFRNVWKLHDRIVRSLRESLVGTDLDPRIRPESLAPEGPREAAGARAVVDFFTTGGEPPVAVAPARPLVTTGRRVFQLHDRYLVEEVDDGVRIIDQHALHERVMLERFRRQHGQEGIVKQRLLLPAVVTLGREARSRLEDHRGLLESFGLEVDDFGPSEVAVRAVPALVADQDPAALLTDFLELADESDPEVPMLERALEFMACRAAVKFGRRLAGEEIARLLEDAEGLDFSSSCAHGRPTGIKLTLQDLERFFQR
jgi:DNA mismatch repair protein MutL